LIVAILVLWLVSIYRKRGTFEVRFKSQGPLELKKNVKFYINFY